MGEWDSAAAGYLRALTAELRGSGLPGLFEDLVAAVWRRNVDGFDPSSGDTARSLGIACHENLRELVLRECADEAAGWRRRGVVASTVDNSLRVDVLGVRLALMKAPPSKDREPNWHGSAFSWDQESDVRRAAAERNTAAYRPADTDQNHRQLTLADDPDAPPAPPTVLRDVLLVWSGDLRSALTAGWIGLPSADRPGWFAVERLWWDEAGGALARPAGDRPAAGDDFASIRVPAPVVRLKTRRDASGER